MPIALPNGLCLFHTHRLIKNKDYEVTCSYPISLRTNVFNEFNPTNPTDTNPWEYFFDQPYNLTLNEVKQKAKKIDKLK